MGSPSEGNLLSVETCLAEHIRKACVNILHTVAETFCELPADQQEQYLAKNNGSQYDTFDSKLTDLRDNSNVFAGVLGILAIALAMRTQIHMK